MPITIQDYKVATKYKTNNKNVDNTTFITTSPDNFKKTPEVDIYNKTDIKKPKDKKMLTALVIAGSIVAGLALGFFSKAKSPNFAKHVDFIKASTMDEAREFANKNFGIKSFDFKDDLEFANWVNEGLTNINNKFKGKAHMPSIICFGDTKNASALGETHKLGKKVVLNEKYFTKDYLLNKIIKNGDFLFKYNSEGKVERRFGLLIPQERINEIARIWDTAKKDPNSISRTELIKAAKKYSGVEHSRFYVPDRALKTYILNNKKIMQKINDAGIKIDMLEFSKMNINEQEEFIQNLCNRFNIDYSTKYNIALDPIGVLYHEMGHVQQFKNSNMFDLKFGKLSDNKSVKTGLELSTYASSNKKEFVAETFTAIMQDQQLSNDVIKLYQQYNGALPPNFCNAA